MVPLIRANTVQLPRVDLQPPVKMGPSEGWNRPYVIKVGRGGCFGLFFCAQKAPGEAESDFGPQAELIWHFGAETDLFTFQCTDIEVTEPSVQGR